MLCLKYDWAVQQRVFRTIVSHAIHSAKLPQTSPAVRPARQGDGGGGGDSGPPGGVLDTTHIVFMLIYSPLCHLRSQ